MTEVAVAILLKEGKILACQRRRTAVYSLKWEFPGGKVEPGETAEQTVARELQEELNVRPVAFRRFHRQEWTYTEGVSNPHLDGAFRVTYYLVPSFSGSPENRVFEQILWLSPEDLLTMDILEGNREAIAHLIRHGQDRLPDTA